MYEGTYAHIYTEMEQTARLQCQHCKNASLEISITEAWSASIKELHLAKGKSSSCTQSEK